MALSELYLIVLDEPSPVFVGTQTTGGASSDESADDIVGTWIT